MDLNHGPAGYESAALTTELLPQEWGTYTEMTSRIGFSCPGIPTFARGEGRLYLSPNIDLPSPLAKFRRRICQNRFLKSLQYIK
jgi:hypothetical protein